MYLLKFIILSKYKAPYYNMILVQKIQYQLKKLSSGNNSTCEDETQK